MTFPSRKKLGIALVFLVSNVNIVFAQDILGLSSRFDDILTEWTIYYDNNGNEGQGSLFIKNPQAHVPDRWVFSFDEFEGVIKQNFPGDHNHWILETKNERIHIRTIWTDNFCDWKISNREISVDFSCLYAGDFQTWEMRNHRMGELEISMSMLNDPRDWRLDYKVIDQITPMIQLAMLFAAVTTSL